VMALPIAEKSALALMMAAGALLALTAWRISKNVRGTLTSL